jgi:alpha-L-fucosidase
LNGNLPLNLSPDGQGATSAPQVATLKEIGQWLAMNGEAVYGSLVAFFQSGAGT